MAVVQLEVDQQVGIGAGADVLTERHVLSRSGRERVDHRLTKVNTQGRITRCGRSRRGRNWRRGCRGSHGWRLRRGTERRNRRSRGARQRQWALVIALAHHADVPTVVVGDRAGMVVAYLTTADAVGHTDGRRIGHPILFRIVVGGIARVARPEQGANDARVHQLRDVGKDVLGPIVLEVPVGVALALKVLIADRHLPDQQGLVVVGRRRTVDELLPAAEIGVLCVQPIPPAVLTELRLVLARVSIKWIVEQQLVWAELVQEDTHLLAERGAIQVRVGIDAYIRAWRPRAYFVAKQDVRRVQVTQVCERQGEPEVRVGDARDVGKP